MNLDTALTDMASELDELGYNAKDITFAGHVLGMMAAMVVEDEEAFNHFISKVAIKYDMAFKPKEKYVETIVSNSSIWSLS